MPDKIVFQFDVAGLLTGSTVADESPMEPGVYLMPANCTATPPPDDVPADKWPRWNGSRWDLVNRPKAAEDESAVDKLAAFLSQNPDVAALISNPGGV